MATSKTENGDDDVQKKLELTSEKSSKFDAVSLMTPDINRFFLTAPSSVYILGGFISLLLCLHSMILRSRYIVNKIFYLR